MDQIRNLLEKFVSEEANCDGSEAVASTKIQKPAMRIGISSHHGQPAPCSYLPLDEVESEAITIAADYLLQSGFPLSFALPTARRCIDKNLQAYLAIAASRIQEKEIDSNFMGGDTFQLGPKDDVLSITPKDDGHPVNDEDSKMVDSTELQKLVRKTVRAYCQELLSGENWKDLVDKWNLPKAPYEWSSHAVRNSRRKMEDRHVMVPNVAWLYPNIPQADQTAAFAVYDGHGGQECAEYARSHGFHHVFHSSSYPRDLCQALQDGFTVMDARMLKYCERESRPSGTTAVAAIIKDNTVYAAWAGDSRALIVNRCDVKKLTDPIHDTKNKAELARIESVGGLVFNFQGQDRVNGLLNITRSLGDLALKPTPLTAQPEVSNVQLTGCEACLVLASDGLFEGLDWDQVGQLVRDYLKQHPIEEYIGLAKHLVDVACNKTSDNVTVVVAFLQSMERLKEWFH